MNKSQLIDRIIVEVGLTKTQACAALQAFESALTDSLSQGERVKLIGFGSFKVKVRAPRSARNLHTGQTVQVPARSAVVFKAGKALKDAVNAP